GFGLIVTSMNASNIQAPAGERFILARSVRGKGRLLAASPNPNAINQRTMTMPQDAITDIEGLDEMDGGKFALGAAPRRPRRGRRMIGLNALARKARADEDIEDADTDDENEDEERHLGRLLVAAAIRRRRRRLMASAFAKSSKEGADVYENYDA